MALIEEHINSKIVLLGNELSKKFLIYLDQNFWINLRKCMSGNAISDEFSNFYNILSDLVVAKKVCCPINNSVFWELFKQDNQTSRLLTAKVIDFFSGSVTLAFNNEIDELELQYYIRENLFNENNLPSIKKYIWVKIPFVMGTLIPQAPYLTEKMRCDCFDYFWNTPLEKMIDIPNQNLQLLPLNKNGLVAELNDGKFKHANQVKSLSNLFEKELKGVLSVFEEQVNDYFSNLKMFQPATVKKLQEELLIKTPKELCNNILNDVLNRRINKHFPRIVITSSIHAMMRWNKNRRYKANDFYDFQHASAALSYYDYFFTERSLKELVVSKPFELSKKYGCIVENEISKINQILLRVSASEKEI